MAGEDFPDQPSLSVPQIWIATGSTREMMQLSTFAIVGARYSPAVTTHACSVGVQQATPQGVIQGVAALVYFAQA